MAECHGFFPQGKVGFVLVIHCFKLGDGIQAVKGRFRICSPFRISGFEKPCGYYTDETPISQRNIVTNITGRSRHQATLFPESLDELIAQDHPVRDRRLRGQSRSGPVGVQEGCC
jgi:hypothetical protein